MTEADTILKMIEIADPENEIALNEIDSHVYSYLKLNGDFKVSIHSGGGSITYRHKSWSPENQSVLIHLFDHYRYTRSRDLLKAIRPKGWSFQGCRETDEHKFWCELRRGFQTSYTKSANAANVQTEELAELHAIIQAIEYERRSGSG